MTTLAEMYAKRHDESLRPISANLEVYLRDLFKDTPRVDRISARAKSVDRFLSKSASLSEGRPKYAEPLVQIQDQIGARIVVFYEQDVEEASKVAEQFFRHIERKEMQPVVESEFSYFGRHYIFFVPKEVVASGIDRALVPTFFELQIKTLFQHAWSEASHDVGYKPLLGELSRQDRRLLAFASAQAWGADHAFAEIFARVSARAESDTADLKRQSEQFG